MTLGHFRLPGAVVALVAVPGIALAQVLPDDPPPLPVPLPTGTSPSPQPPEQQPPQAPPSSESPSPPPPPPVNPAEHPSIFGGPDGRVLLGGTWAYRGDRLDVGVRRGFGRGDIGGRHVRVPYVPNSWPVTGRSGARNFQGGIGWYEKHFRVPKAGTYALRFESVHHRATVWVNGRRLGTHVGAYLPFEYRVKLRGQVKNTLVVRADWRDPIAMKRQGWHRGWFNFGGINREVTIRPVGRSELGPPQIQTRIRRDGTAAVSVAVRVRNNAATRTITVKGALVRDRESHDFAFRPVRVAKGGSRTVRRRFVLKDPAYWSPGRPAMYGLRVAVDGESGQQAAIGLREIALRDGQLTLNGRRLVLYGASIHEDVKRKGDAIDAADADRIVARLKAIGANATRALHPLHPVLLERLDRAGILVWQQVGPFDSPGNWMAVTPAKRRIARDRVMQSVYETQSHPSILTWGVANEIADNGHEAGQAGWVDQVARELHRVDPGRPVSVDIWGTRVPRRPGRIYRNIDLIGVTSYIGWYEFPFDSRARKLARIRGRVARLRRLFPDKPLFITEFGAEANQRNPSQRWGGFAYQASLIGLHLRAYQSMPDKVSGMLIWNLSDFALTPAFAGGSITGKVKGIKLLKGINQKGLYDYSGRAKPSAREALAASASVRAASF